MNILLLGATGSIGDSVLSVIEENHSELNLFGITFHKNINKSQEIIKDFKPEFAYVEDRSTFEDLKDTSDITFLNGDSSLKELIEHDDVDVIISAISGFAGLKATYLAASTGKKILLANKESIVAGGDLITARAKKFNSKIIPIDSEHNAIFQCLYGERSPDDVQKIIITASGGPFLGKKISDLKDVTKDDALNHPNWDMGSKISIDSATLVNKCLELIEAKYLFDLEESIFDLVIHPQSIVHSVVTYKDGSSICQMSMPDMRVPIAHALSNEHRLPINFEKINFNDLNLSFHAFPEDRLQIQKIAREVCNSGGHLGTIFNAANEVAVESFLNDQISFDKIYEVIHRTFDNNSMSKDVSIESIYEADTQTRIKAKKVVKSIT